MSDTITINALERTVLGKKVRSLRAAGQIPAVLHNHGKQSLHVSVEAKQAAHVFSAAGKHHPVSVVLDGKNHTALIRDVDYVPGKIFMNHMVFQLVNADEKVEATIPVEVTGEVPAVRSGLQMIEQLKEVEVKAFPRDLVDALQVSGESLSKDGDTVTVADIVVPKGIEIMTDPDQVLASIETPKDQIADADAALAEQAEQDSTPAVVEAEEPAATPDAKIV